MPQTVPWLSHRTGLAVHGHLHFNVIVDAPDSRAAFVVDHFTAYRRWRGGIPTAFPTGIALVRIHRARADVGSRDEFRRASDCSSLASLAVALHDRRLDLGHYSSPNGLERSPPPSLHFSRSLRLHPDPALLEA